ncbi:MAG: 2-amino-4-hydroxy-6-hydroxymethyldihydropteridine diphosphokinase [Saezia sp.]
MCSREDIQSPVVTAWIGLGGNLGDIKKTLKNALQVLNDSPHIADMHVSSFYESVPVDAQGENFINAVACFQTTLTPMELLYLLQSIELKFGRERPYWHAPRTLDLDLLLYGDLMMQGPELTLPHHAMHERAFVLLPLAELNDQLVIPPHGGVKDLLEEVKGQSIKKLDESWESCAH